MPAVCAGILRLWFHQPEPGGFESSFDNFTLHFCLPNGIAKAILRMRIAVIIYRCTVYKVSFAIHAYSQVATLAFEAKFALAASGFHYLQLLRAVRLWLLLRLQCCKREYCYSQKNGFHVKVIKDSKVHHDG